MKRREFITLLGGAAAPAIFWPLAARPQPIGKVARIGFLGSATAVGSAKSVEALRLGLRDLGYVEGKNIVIEFQWAEGRYERLPALLAELIRRNVDVLVVHGTPGTRAAKQATTKIPIVVAIVGDALASGIVTSLARPEANLTGSTYFLTELNVKRLELLKDVFPYVARVAALSNPDNPVSESIIPAMTAAATPLKIELELAKTQGPTEFDGAFAAMAKSCVDAVVVTQDGEFAASFKTIATLAARIKLPSIGSKEYAEAGGLIGYGVNLLSLYRRAAYFVDLILKGARPADLPVEQPTKFELVINLKTAKALGLDVSASDPASRRRGDRMKRRKFIAGFGAMAAWPVAAMAQRSGKPAPRVGVLLYGTPETDPNYGSFRRGLRELGYVEGQNIVLEPRSAESKPERLPVLARELVAAKPDLIYVLGGDVAPFVRSATSTIPIVMAVSNDPVQSGLVASLARPGGNVTGVTFVSSDLAAKRLQFLRELAPQLARVAVLWNPDHVDPEYRETQIAGRTLDVQVQSLEVRSPADFDRAYQTALSVRAEALMPVSSRLLTLDRAGIIAFAAQHRLLLASGWGPWAREGAILSYGPDLDDITRRSAAHVDKILRGASPAELPVEQPTRFQLVINGKVAKILGLRLPEKLLALADEVIE